MQQAATRNPDSRMLKSLRSGLAPCSDISGGCASGHLVAEPFEPVTCFALALVDQLDGLVPGHRSRDHGSGMLADGLIDEIVAARILARGPFEADRGDGAGADLRIIITFRDCQG